jgi:uncharacterized membrane protein/nitrite reductase/ring-hydroxylating ferredoxin subunit
VRSKAHVRGHPIHPALVHFPIAFLFGAFGFDLVGRLTGNPALWVTGGWLAILGVASALVAAIPGFIDYFLTVPPRSSGKRRATWHMALNLLVVALFAGAVLLRRGGPPNPGDTVLLLEGVGVVLLGISGYLGGVLLTRNQIGVDHRYAEAGKWREASLAPRANGEVVVARSGELAVDQMKLLRVMGKRIVLARTEDGYTAFDDHCTHRGGSLADGVIISGQVQCPWHGSQFDCRTGAVVNGPARERIGTYAVEERDGQVLLRLDRMSPDRPQRIPVATGR